ncbi:MAG: adenylosuccinate synthase [Phycisphaerae bacterium]|nr:adenylosuccinate synthase [Phycisphaerae bacterium]
MGKRNVTVVGLQWGDEGKGKVVDALAGTCRYVVRFCGGANAGHSVMIGDQKYAMHLIPCGVFSPGVVNVIGNGVVFDPAVAIEELDGLAKRGVAVGPDTLRISSAAHVVMPYHRRHDELAEAQLGRAKIGTTARGIGPCYADKATRSTAIRVGDLIDETVLRDKIAPIVALKNKVFAALYGAAPMDAAAMADEYVAHGRRLAPMIGNTGAMLRRAIAEGQRILFEGGQGTMLDIDHGTYPFVTSSSVSACGVPAGAGVPPGAVGQVVGVIKAYTSRIGAGPFPTEQDNDIGARLRERGNEYGTTTGRPRRCGWFDAFAVGYAASLSGVDVLALSLLDVLSGLEEVKICTGYRVDGTVLADYDPAVLGKAEGIYETLPGWAEEIADCRKLRDLPREARAYVRRIEELLGRPVGFISVGSERTASIIPMRAIEGLR